MSGTCAEPGKAPYPYFWHSTELTGLKYVTRSKLATTIGDAAT